jgi:hypothetical protein
VGNHTVGWLSLVTIQPGKAELAATKKRPSVKKVRDNSRVVDADPDWILNRPGSVDHVGHKKEKIKKFNF